MFSDLDIQNFVRTVSNTPEGMDFIYYLLDEFGTFNTKISLNKTELQNICEQIKREQGEFILDLLRIHNFEKYTEIQQRRSNEKCQKTMN